MARSISKNNLKILGRRVSVSAVWPVGWGLSLSRTFYRSRELVAFNLWVGRLMLIMLVDR